MFGFAGRVRLLHGGLRLDMSGLHLHHCVQAVGMTLSRSEGGRGRRGGERKRREAKRRKGKGGEGGRSEGRRFE